MRDAVLNTLGTRADPCATGDRRKRMRLLRICPGGAVPLCDGQPRDRRGPSPDRAASVERDGFLRLPDQLGFLVIDRDGFTGRDVLTQTRVHALDSVGRVHHPSYVRRKGAEQYAPVLGTTPQSHSHRIAFNRGASLEFLADFERRFRIGFLGDRLQRLCESLAFLSARVDTSIHGRGRKCMHSPSIWNAPEAIGDSEQYFAHAAGLQVAEDLKSECGSLDAIVPGSQEVARSIDRRAKGGINRAVVKFGPLLHREPQHIEESHRIH